MILTVFTPSYNRAHLLSRCYESLKKQTNKNFVWMIIDDGSTDQTGEIVREWQKDNKLFTIEYYYKENGGLHTAYNEAIAHIRTPLCVCIDSDDWMPEDAVDKILSFWNKEGSDQVAGIVGLDFYEDGQIVGDRLPNQRTINLIDLLIGIYRIKNGDRTNVVRTDLYRKYAPMKSFPGEKFFNPHYMHLQISRDYDFLVLNECLRVVEYQSDGMTNNIFKQYKNSPRSFAEIRTQYLSFQNTPFLFRLKNLIHLASSYILSGDYSTMVSKSKYRLGVMAVFPLGLLLSLYIQLRSKS